jgi:hypothetical protein
VVPLRLAYRIPNGGFQMFMLAAAEGRGMNSRGGFDNLRDRERPIGVRVGRVHRDRILDQLGLERGPGLQRWQRNVRMWRRLDLAHACGTGRLFLLLKQPAGDICPDCKASLDEPRTRHLVKPNASSGEPSYVQKREPSTGTQRGDGGQEGGVEEEGKEYLIKEDSSISARSMFQEAYYGPGYKSYMRTDELPLDADLDEHDPSEVT